jgi:hypothetical protein
VSPHNIDSRAHRTLAYLDALGYGQHPGESSNYPTVVEALEPRARVLLVAWLGPHASLSSKSDNAAAKHVSPTRRAPQDVAADFRRFLATAVKASQRPVYDVAAHVGWRASLSTRDLDRLLDGQDGFSIPCILDLCDALQLEFRDRWLLIDPERLARRIDESLTALQLVGRLRDLSGDRLESLYRRFPNPSPDTSAVGPYLPPLQGTRYRALFEVLASDDRLRPSIGVRDLDQALQERGEGAGLPRSAYVDRSWWAGTGSKTAGRPQVSAWWAAGYRVGTLETDAETGAVLTVTFEALPGRDIWLADPRRLEGYGFEEREPEPEARPIVGERAADILVPRSLLFGMSASAHDGLASDEANHTEEPDGASEVHDDLTNRLVSSLDELGEADRATVAAHLDVSLSDTELSNLLTRARRRGHVVNHGTRTRPRWVVAGSKGDLMFEIGRTLSFDPPPMGPGSVIGRRFFELVAHNLSLEVPRDAMKVDVVRTITASADIEWSPTFVSGGNNITLAGLEAVRDAVRIRTGADTEGAAGLTG